MNNIFKKSLQLILLLFLVSSLLSGVSYADKNELNELIEKLQATYEKTSNISASFQQETIPAGSKEGIKARGKVYFARPSKMRWEYEEPEKQIIVTSGKDVYVYEQEAAQVMVIPREKFLSSEISQAFFFGKGKLEKYFRVRLAREDWLKGKGHLRLEPIKDNLQIKTMWIGLDPESGIIKEVWMEDRLGTRTHIIFSDVAVNTRLSPKIFEFRCPAGVEIYKSENI